MARMLKETLPGGYKPFTTFFTDLDIANGFGVESVKDTYKRVTEQWLDDYKYYTEFVMCLNLHLWDRYQNHGKDDPLARLYNDLFFEAKEKLWNRWENDDEASEYIFNTLD